ncbi:MAG: hypothetical protein IIC49_07845, partial [Planctomycetes bacterium]|nr:hypothetical protein [Planctomycetota bacterium]
MAERTVLLMGLRGSGKSTIGREFAAASGRTFIDLDELTLVRLGTESVAEAWARFGESAFRAAEREELDRVLRSRPSGRTIVALGGGTPTAPGAEYFRSGKDRRRPNIPTRRSPTRRSAISRRAPNYSSRSAIPSSTPASWRPG